MANPFDERVLIWAPRGRDADLIRGALDQAGYVAEICSNLNMLCAEITRGVGAVAIEEEVLKPVTVNTLVGTLDEQPPWSDLPFIIFAPRLSPIEMLPRQEQLRDLRNVTVLERPIYPTTLVTAVKSALRARHRQYELRDHLSEREVHLKQIEELNRELEQRVQERTTEMLQARQAFYQAQKLEAIGRLAGGVAHDFNNLMTGILGMSEEVMSALGEGHPARADLEEIIRAGQKAAALTRQLLAFGRQQVASQRVFSANTVIQDMTRIFQRLLGENVQVELRLAPDLGSVLADPGHLEQVIINLVINARDAMPQGGKITIETANADITQKVSKGDYQILPGRFVVLSVSDTGIGMSREVLNHLFEPFFTTKEQGKGTGLGLATAYGIVKQSQGYISVQSEVNKGTTFKVYLPRVLDEQEIDRQVSRPARVPGGTETILLVEDEDIVRRVARKALQNRGYTVLEAHHGEEALQISRQNPGRIDMLLTDVVMPGMNGRQLAETLSRECPDIAVLYMSGHPRDIIADQGVLAAGIDFIEKSFSSESLCRKVREVLDTCLENRAEHALSSK